MNPETKRIERIERLITAHPLAAVGVGFAVGALAGVLAAGKDRGRIRGAVFGALSGLLVSVVRDAMLGQLGGYAKSWIDQRDRSRATSFEPEVETFFEH